MTKTRIHNSEFFLLVIICSEEYDLQIDCILFMAEIWWYHHIQEIHSNMN